jgi:hypothetical protein
MSASCGPRERLGAERQGHLFDVLGCGGKQTLGAYTDQSSEAGIAMAVQLLGVGEGAFDRGGR